MPYSHKSRGKKGALNFTQSYHERFHRCSLNFLLWWRFSCSQGRLPYGLHHQEQASGPSLLAKIRENWSVYNAHCERLPRNQHLVKTLKCVVIWTGFKIQHCTTINLASSSPVFNLSFLQKIVWKGAASQIQHLSSSNFWITVIQASGCLLEGEQHVIYCGQWSPWGSGRKPGVHPDVTGQPVAASTGSQEVFSECSCACPEAYALLSQRSYLKVHFLRKSSEPWCLSWHHAWRQDLDVSSAQADKGKENFPFYNLILCFQI